MKFSLWPDAKTYREIDLSLTRVYDLLARLDNPHLKLPPTIHIAGTNGKGSTLSFLRAIFTEAKMAVHTYTSPHLVNFNERVIINNCEISDEFFTEVLLECKKASELEPVIPVTFFEATTIAAFLAFSRIKADVLLLEVGMGGRLDATNVLSQVLCSIITPIALDHQEFLGETLEKIALEKAGIIKKNCPVIIAKQEDEVLRVLENRALELVCAVKSFKRDYKIRLDKDVWYYDELKLPLPSLIGDHQIENAATAIKAVLATPFKIAPEIIAAAITKVTWPARLQKISSGKFLQQIPQGAELYLDGSHNLQGATTVLEFLKLQKNKKIIVIFAMLKDKDCEGFLKKIAMAIDVLIALEIPDEPNSRSAIEVKNIAEKSGIKNVVMARDFDEALAKIKEPALTLICGSLYLAGSFLSQSSEK